MQDTAAVCAVMEDLVSLARREPGAQSRPADTGAERSLRTPRQHFGSMEDIENVQEKSVTVPKQSIGGVLASLTDLMGDRVTAARHILESHGRSEAYHALQLPELVAFPEKPAEVQQIVRLCAQAGMPIVPFGAGTSLEGNAAAPSASAST
jgi:hypothetical protein